MLTKVRNEKIHNEQRVCVGGGGEGEREWSKLYIRLCSKIHSGQRKAAKVD